MNPLVAFVSSGTALVVLGGLVSAVAAPWGPAHGRLVAYLVLVCGVAQCAMGLAQEYLGAERVIAVNAPFGQVVHDVDEVEQVAPKPDQLPDDQGVALAAELVGTPAQSLRLNETRGLLRPDRTTGGTRRYSTNDLARLRRISDLHNEGLNLVGIAMVLDLQDENSELRNTPHPTTSSTSHTPGGARSGRVNHGASRP